MDEIELMVEETYRHYQERFPEGDYIGEAQVVGMRKLEEVKAVETQEELAPNFDFEEIIDSLPTNPGIIYHIQKSTTVFVIRTFVSRNIREDHARIIEHPEEFPSLRLLEGGVQDLSHRLRFFLVDNPNQAEIIHDQLNNRRFPVDEEMMCNISDPGFSWWLTPKGRGFQLSFTLSVSSGEESIKLGPLGDQQIALKNFRALEVLMTKAGLDLSMQNEMRSVQFTDGEEMLLEELRDLFEYGVVSGPMTDLFRLLARGIEDMSSLESCWFYLQELAAMRRFWIQVQYDLGST
jgi:hypothetical protein